jgi:uncharacterized RDD family membrane protein YckC
VSGGLGRGFVTPEAVVIDLQQASVGSRLVAQLVDGVLVVVITVLAVLAPLAVAEGMIAAMIGISLVFFVQIGYFALWEGLWEGRTPGKRALRLRVVRQDGSPITATEALVRNVLRVVDLLPVLGLVGIVSILVTRRDQRVGDLAAGPVVVHEGRGTEPETLALDAADAPAWAPRLDVSDLDERDYAVARSYLQRRHALTSDARRALAARIADPLRRAVRGVPEEAPDEHVIVAVVAALRARRGR